MKWLLSRFAISNLVYFLRPRFSSSVPHSCSWFFPTRRSGSICKESQFNSSRHWPLCYTWIGYRQANGFRREPCYLKSWITSTRCQHSSNAHCSNLTVITTPCRCCQISKCIIPFLFQTALRLMSLFMAVYVVHQTPVMKWLLSRFAISNLVYFLRPRFSSSVPHSCSWFFPTRRSGSICKESQFNSSRHWPLCYTWIGYRQANGFRREPCYLKSWMRL